MFVEAEVPEHLFEEPPTDLVWSVQTSTDGEKFALAAFAKRTYRYDGRGRVTLADAQRPLTLEPDVVEGNGDDYLWLRDDVDVLGPKERTDVVLTAGNAHPPKPTPRMEVAFGVGPSHRTLGIFGARHLLVGRDGTVRFSEPALLTEPVPLTPEEAYGGYDGYAQALMAPPSPAASYGAGGPVTGLFAYPRNGAGRGYFIDLHRRRVDSSPLPQIEDLADPLRPHRFFLPSPRSWTRAPLPGLLGWTAHAWFPRVVRMVGSLLEGEPPRDAFRETRFADGDDLEELMQREAARPTLRARQGAAPGLAATRLHGGEAVLLRNLDAAAGEIRFELPRERPELQLTPPDLGQTFRPEPILQTVRIDAEQRTVSLTWTGTVPLAVNAPPEFLQQCVLAVTWKG